MSSGSLKMLPTNHSFFYKMNLALNNLQGLICHKTQTIQWMSCGVMVKALDSQNRNKQVRTAVVLLRSLSDKYPWER